MAPNVTTIVLVGAAGAAAIYLFILRQRRLAMLPTDEEQKWLDEQIITPRPPCMSPGSLVSEEEQKWLDKQIQNVETEEVRLCPAAAVRVHSFSRSLLVRCSPGAFILTFASGSLPSLARRCWTMRGKRPTHLGRAAARRSRRRRKANEDRSESMSTIAIHAATRCRGVASHQ